MKVFIKRFLVIFTCYLLLLPSLVFAGDNSSQAVEDDHNFYKSTNALIYIAQGLLDDKKNWDVAYDILTYIQRNDDSLSEVVKSKIKKAASLIKKSKFYKVVDFIIGSQYKERPHIKAQMLLAEALMDSRVDMNVPNDSEKRFVENLIKNYIFPGHPERVQIEYPDVSYYAFDKWALTEENIKNADILPSDIDDSFINRLIRAREENMENLDFPEIPNKKIKRRRKGKKIKKGYTPGESADEEMEPPLPSSTEVEEVDTLSEAEENIDYLGESFKLAESSIHLTMKYNKLRQRVSNLYINQAMLMQAIAEPKSIKYDPQLQEFVKNLRIKINLGEAEIPQMDEIQFIQNYLGEDIIKENNGDIALNLTKMYGLSRVGTSSNLNLIYERNKTGKVVVFLSSTLFGEDMQFLKYATIGLATGKKIYDSGTAIAAKTGGLLFKDLLRPISNSVLYKKFQLGNTLISLPSVNTGGLVGIPAKIQNLSKATKIYLSVRDTISGIATPIRDIMNNKVIKKVATKIDVMSKGKIGTWFKNGTLLRAAVGLSVVAEVTVGTIDYMKADTRFEKSEVLIETFARMGAVITYLTPIGLATGMIDLAHVFGLPVETADVFRLGGYILQKSALKVKGSNMATFKLSSIESKLRPGENNYKYGFYVAESGTKKSAVENYVKIANLHQLESLKYLMIIYWGHRNLSRAFFSREMYNFGERISVYKQNFMKSSRAMLEAEASIFEIINNSKSEIY